MCESLISLIPKEVLESVSQFRLIALCIVTIKLITKIIANWLKPMIYKLVAETQAGFIPGILASNNRVIVQELIHSIRKKLGWKGAMTVKVDFEKAYDWIEWNFLETIVHIIGFDDHITSLIMFCIKSASLTIIWNGSKLQSFKP